MGRLRRVVPGSAALLALLLMVSAAPGSAAVETSGSRVREIGQLEGDWADGTLSRLVRSRPAPLHVDSLDRALRTGELTSAEYAFDRARMLFAPDSVRDEFGAVRSPGLRAGTPTLLELAAHLKELNPADRRAALELFARPTDGDADPLGDGYDLDRTDVRYDCQAEEGPNGKTLDLCVHWAEKTKDAPPANDSNGNGIPDQVETTHQVLAEVWGVEVTTYGYRMPLPDEGKKQDQGPNRGLDVYLEDIGADGLFGYCTTDDPRQQPQAHAYCVLDDDYAAGQFGDLAGLPALEVAAAHEFFHAIQFAYEFSNEDRWLKEGTAVWMEDEVYDDVNDLYVFLEDSALLQPEIPLDAFQSPSDGENFEYGAWVFWRFLSEYFGTPDIIRDVWETAAGNKSALAAVRMAAASHEPLNGILPTGPANPYRRAVAEFGMWNRIYDRVYEEGSAYAVVLNTYPPDDAVFLLDDQRRGTGPRQLAVDHLSSRDVVIVPASTSATELRVTLDLPDYQDGPEANMFWFTVDGNGFVSSIQLDEAGDAEVRLLGVSQVAYVVLILHDTSGSLDGLSFGYEATLVS